MHRNRRQAIRRAARIVRLFLASEARPQAIGWMVALLLLLLMFNGLNVANSYVGRDFMTAVSERRWDDYVRYSIAYALVFLASTAVASLNRFSEERLRLLWRGWTTRRLIGRYLEHHAYYRLNKVSEIDNPDQRITDDVKSFTQTALAFTLLSMGATITSLSFLGVLWSITPWLVLVAVAYAAIGTGLTVWLGRPLVKLNNLQLKKEADLRYNLIRLREEAEPVAVTHAEEAFSKRLGRRLDEVVRNNKAIIANTRNLTMFTGGYNYMIQLIPIVIVAPLYLRGRIEFGVVTQSAMAFSQVLNALSLFVTQFETLSSFAAVADRLDAVVDAVERAQRRGPSAVEVVEDDGRLAFEGLTLRDPGGGAPLLDDLNLAPGPVARLLVAGPNVVGKKALFLAIAGICEEGSGRIVCPGRDRTFFLPRLPLLGTGRLREQFALGLPGGESPDDGQILGALRSVGLGPALDRLGGLDAEHDLQAALSLGERQLLAFARLGLAGPVYAFLDHVTEALAPDQVGPLFRSLEEAGIGYVSFGEDPDLASYHDTVLDLRDDGTWQAEDTRPGEAATATPSPGPAPVNQ